MTQADVEISRRPALSWLLDAPALWRRALRARKPRVMDIRELSPYLRRDIGA